MTRDEALAFCKEHDLRPTMSHKRRPAMTSEQTRAFMLAYSTSDPDEMPPEVVARVNEAVAKLDARDQSRG